MSLSTWMSSRVFSYMHGNHLIYNTCWEDPRLDRIALDIQPDDNILVITSAGCNALDYALMSPNAVHAVDMNFRQNALLELKKAGIRHLDYEKFFEMFGHGRLASLESEYRSKLRPDLSPDARVFWDNRLHFFKAGRGESFYFHGTSGYFAWMLNRYLDARKGLRDMVDQCLNAESVEEQREIYFGGMRDKFWNKPMQWVANRDTTLAMVGVPQAQRIQVERYYEGGIAQFAQECLEAVFAHLPMGDNYFWRVYLTGQYSRTCCPEYLREENFAKLQGGLVEKVHVHTDHVTGFLEKHDQHISKFVLLDHMDWLSTQKNALLQQEWQAILNNAANQSRLIWRSGGLTTDFLDPLEVEYKNATWQLNDLLTFDRNLANDLHQKDRVHTYGSFHIADLAKA